METYTNIFQEVGHVREYFEDSGFHQEETNNKQTNTHKKKTEDTKDEVEDRETKKVVVAKEELGDE